MRITTKAAASTLAFSLLSISAQAQSDTYAFGGACPSQGAWTQTALAQTKNITSIIEKLKDNPKCKGIESVVKDLGAATEVLKLPDGDQNSSTIEALPGEIDALRKVMSSRGGLTNQIQHLLFKKTLTAASIGGAAAGATNIPLDGTSAVRALYHRTKRATEYGIAATERVFQALPGLDECLIGQPDQGMALVAAAVKIGASFASSGEGVGTRLGSAIGSLVTMMRDRKFTLAMRKNHETEFWLSVSCLLETSTKNYCDANNAQELLQFSQAEYLRTRGAKLNGKVDPNYDNPLEGYYLLVRELPTIAQWLRAVKLGTAPKLSSDAAFQINAISKINEMQKMDKHLRAEFAQEIEVMKAIPEPAGRKNKMFAIIASLVGAMTNGGNPASEFFTNSISAMMVPFYLVGMGEIPMACRATEGNAQAKPWDQWMQSGGENGGLVKQFDDPDALARTVETRLNVMIDSANQKAGIFFRQRLVIDLLNLVNKTLVGQNLTVRQSLKHLDRYLERFEGRLTNSSADMVMLPSVRDTRTRIKKVLAAYVGLAHYGRALRTNTVRTQVDAEGKPIEEGKVMVDAAKVVIDSVFNELNVLYQSDVFLTNRLTSFIERDFAIMINSDKIRATPTQQQLMKVSQDHLVEQLIQVHGMNPNPASNDLHIAQFANVRNLQSIEQIFGDTFFLALEELNEIAHGRPATNWSMQKLMRARKKKDRNLMRQAALATPNPFTVGGNWLGWLAAEFTVGSNKPDLYRRPSDVMRISAADTPFKDFAGVRAQFCAQTLAFETRYRYIDFCKGAVLKSYFSPPGKITSLDLVYDSYLPNAAFNKQIKADPLKSAKAKCALNDYNTRNWVEFLGDRDRQTDNSESDD